VKTIAIANQKGGVGKTTVTREISACCALRGFQTLAIDCDPQGNLTSSWADPEGYEKGVAKCGHEKLSKAE
jgi:chromosome partitioning protein